MDVGLGPHMSCGPLHGDPDAYCAEDLGPLRQEGDIAARMPACASRLQDYDTNGSPPPPRADRVIARHRV